MQFLKDHPNLNRLIDRATTKARVAQNPQYGHQSRSEAYGLLRGICEALEALGYVEERNTLRNEIWARAKEGRR